MKRYIWPVLIAALLMLGGWGWYATGARSSTQVPQVMTTAVTRGAIQETVLAEGTLKPSRLVAVGAQVTGRITSVQVVPGQEVKAGDLIAEIDSVTQRNQLRTAEARAGLSRPRKPRKRPRWRRPAGSRNARNAC
ncbi:biotin/lipoyl-binding protein [Paracoccus sp. DMF-8]|uniref:biotin/lipoyl-binding protein n=1 Tax=Paracoccus sp. DMF-8 TaxID=3019445 RepID=UPI0023E7F9F4|nr:biotin/lipoyl-binding protein [Paracoccus sp. DMF-8]MDF3605802.1 biotin/lipoyl-binding protein [Paracoccus sp. DMF-8]